MLARSIKDPIVARFVTPGHGVSSDIWYDSAFM